MATYRRQKTPTRRKIFLLRILVLALYRRLRYGQAEMMTTLADGFLNLGGVYVKFLQGVLFQIPMMRLWKNENRFDVYENVPTDIIDIESFFLKNLSKDQLKEIKEASKTPFASGSFGQVYKGRLENNKEVVFKILRPNTRKLLKSDLRLIGLVSRFIAGLLTSWDVDLRRLVKQFISSTLRETDYIAEARFANQLYNYYLNNQTIVIPKTYTELSGKNMIVQDYIGGVSLAQLLKDKQHNLSNADLENIVHEATGSNMEFQLTQLGVEINKAILNSVPVHGDPHPGNIRLLSDNRVALIDFGVETKPIKSPEAYYAVMKELLRAEYLNTPDPGKMFISYIRFYSGRLYESLKLFSEYVSTKSKTVIKIDDWIAEFGNKIFKTQVTQEMLLNGLDKIRNGESAKEISVDKIVNTDNRFQVGVRIEDGSILRTVANYMSLVTELGYRSIVPKVYNQVVQYVEQFMPQLNYEHEPNMGVHEAIETVYLWLEKIANKDSELYQEIMSYIGSQ